MQGEHFIPIFQGKFEGGAPEEKVLPCLHRTAKEGVLACGIRKRPTRKINRRRTAIVKLEPFSRGVTARRIRQPLVNVYHVSSIKRHVSRDGAVATATYVSTHDT